MDLSAGSGAGPTKLIRGGCSSVTDRRAFASRRPLADLEFGKTRVANFFTLTRALSSPHSIVKDLHGTALAPEPAQADEDRGSHVLGGIAGEAEVNPQANAPASALRARTRPATAWLQPLAVEG